MSTNNTLRPSGFHRHHTLAKLAILVAFNYKKKKKKKKNFELVASSIPYSSSQESNRQPYTQQQNTIALHHHSLCTMSSLVICLNLHNCNCLLDGCKRLVAIMQRLRSKFLTGPIVILILMLKPGPASHATATVKCRCMLGAHLI